MSTDVPVESLQNDGKAPSERPDGQDGSQCVQHPERRALTRFNGYGVCRECLQVCLDVYHEIALRGFYE